MNKKIIGVFLVLLLILVNIPYVLGSNPLANDPPVCEIVSITPQQPVHGETVTFVGKAMDPENGPKLFYWDVDGDGNWEVSNVQVTGPGWVNHTYVHSNGYSVPANQNSKTFNVILQVLDDQGESDIDTDSVTVTAYPVADADGPYFGNAEEIITFIGSGSYDPNGHIVNWTLEMATWDMVKSLHIHI